MTYFQRRITFSVSQCLFPHYLHSTLSRNRGCGMLISHFTILLVYIAIGVLCRAVTRLVLHGLGCTVKVCNSIQKHAHLCKLIIQHEWKFIYLKLQLTRNRDRICQQPGLMATLSRDWRDIWSLKIVHVKKNVIVFKASHIFWKWWTQITLVWTKLYDVMVHAVHWSYLTSGEKVILTPFLIIFAILPRFWSSCSLLLLMQKASLLN